MKLETLQDRPPVLTDVGKVIYDLIGKEIIEIIDFENKRMETNFSIYFWGALDRLYWQKPIIVSEEEYNENQKEIEKLKELLKKFLYYCQKDYGDFIKNVVHNTKIQATIDDELYLHDIELTIKEINEVLK